MKSKHRRVFAPLLALAAVLFVAIQFVPVSRSNLPVTGDLTAAEPVRSDLRISCYDCHSNETVWPWYGRVAPASWMIARHVNQGRAHLNFSDWQHLSAEELTELREEIGEAVVQGDMPPKTYLALHRDAALTSERKERIRAWTGVAVPSAESRGHHEEEDD